jgi:hypothetical protein
MNVSIEEAIRLAIISRPECFGLMPEDVNPLLKFVMCMTSGEEVDRDDLPAFCFDECNGKVYHRLTEVLRYDAQAKPGTSAKPNQSQPASNGNGKPKPAGGKLSVKQLKYLGYLLHQKGEVPDYKAIGELTTKQATMRIKDLEAEL